MKTRISLFTGAAAVCALLLIPSVSRAQATLISSFTPGVGDLVGAAYDPVAGNVFIYPDFSDAILRFTPGGTQVPPDPASPGTPGNDYDMDFAPVSFNLGGTVVPANTLLVVNGDNSPVTLYGLNKDTGAILASVVLPVSSVGGSFHAARGTFFNVSSTTDTIQEINAETGAILNSFGVVPGGSSPFDVAFGDVEVNQATGNLYVVSSGQDIIRELTPTGGFVRDIAVGGLTVSGMSGIGFNDAANEAFISSTNGNVYRVGGFPGVASAAPEPSTFALLALSGLPIAGTILRRRRSA